MIREFLPVAREQTENGARWVWAVRDEGGRKVIHVAKLFVDTDGRPHLVTSHVANDGSPYGYSKKLWPKEKAALLASRETSSEGLADTDLGASIRPRGDVLSQGASTAAEQNIGQPKRGVNWATEGADPAGAAPGSEAREHLAGDETLGLDPATLDAPEVRPWPRWRPGANCWRGRPTPCARPRTPLTARPRDYPRVRGEDTSRAQRL